MMNEVITLKSSFWKYWMNCLLFVCKYICFHHFPTTVNSKRLKRVPNQLLALAPPCHSTTFEKIVCSSTIMLCIYISPMTSILYFSFANLFNFSPLCSANELKSPSVYEFAFFPEILICWFCSLFKQFTQWIHKRPQMFTWWQKNINARVATDRNKTFFQVYYCGFRQNCWVLLFTSWDNDSNYSSGFLASLNESSPFSHPLKNHNTSIF